MEGHICCALAQVKPTVLVFDDLHWADQASLDLLLNIADLVESERLLIICPAAARQKRGELAVHRAGPRETGRALLGNRTRTSVRRQLPELLGTCLSSKTFPKAFAA